MTAQSTPAPSCLVIACGALAQEILAVTRANGLDSIKLTCLPAHWHNTPQKIVPGVLEKIAAHRDDFERIFVAYGDCGTGGALDRAIDGLNAEGLAVTRIGGDHCYSFFAGAERFDALMDAELGSFFLTDYLVRHFDTLIIEGMGLDRYPEMRDMLFGHYKRLVYLAQAPTDTLRAEARAAADKLGLTYHEVETGYGELTDFLRRTAA